VETFTSHDIAVRTSSYTRWSHTLCNSLRSQSQCGPWLKLFPLRYS